LLLDLGFFFEKYINNKMVTEQKFTLVFVLIVIINELLDTQRDVEVEQTLLYATRVMSSLCPQLLNMATERNLVAETFDV
jgi:hypothetical protein